VTAIAQTAPCIYVTKCGVKAIREGKKLARVYGRRLDVVAAGTGGMLQHADVCCLTWRKGRKTFSALIPSASDEYIIIYVYMYINVYTPHNGNYCGSCVCVYVCVCVCVLLSHTFRLLINLRRRTHYNIYIYMCVCVCIVVNYIYIYNTYSDVSCVLFSPSCRARLFFCRRILIRTRERRKPPSPPTPTF